MQTNTFVNLQLLAEIFSKLVSRYFSNFSWFKVGHNKRKSRSNNFYECGKIITDSKTVKEIQWLDNNKKVPKDELSRSFFRGTNT